LGTGVQSVAPLALAQFETRASQKLPAGSFAAATGDFNRDGNLDVAVVGDYLSIFLGNGDGTFQPPQNTTGPFYAIAVADFNNDGIPDLVVGPYSDSVMVFLGNGDGTFQPPISSATAGPAGVIVVGDFNGDHKLDIAIIDNPYISILLGNGDGTFQAPIDNSSFVGAGWLALGDFNNDHLLDVAVVGSFGGSQNIGVLLGNGDGTLQNALVYPLAHTPGSVVAADFNRDGNLDVAIGEYIGDSVTVLLGDGTGAFGPPQTYLGAGGLVMVSDFNGDGKWDLVATPSVFGAAEFLGNGDGTFQSAQIYNANRGFPAATGDLNGDGKPDLVLLENVPLTITTMLDTGALKFSPSSPLDFPTQVINTTSSQKTVELANTGTTAISISSMQVSGNFQIQNTCGSSIPSGGNCTVSAVFEPTSEGNQTGLVTILDRASSKPQYVELDGSATVVKVSPAALNFGDQRVGTKSKAQGLTATNKGSASITFKAISIGGNDFKDFSEANDCIGATIPPGGSCRVSVTFSPTKSGSRTGTLQLTLQTGGASPAPVTLSGTGD